MGEVDDNVKRLPIFNPVEPPKHSILGQGRQTYILRNGSEIARGAVRCQPVRDIESPKKSCTDTCPWKTRPTIVQNEFGAIRLRVYESCADICWFVQCVCEPRCSGNLPHVPAMLVVRI